MGNVLLELRSATSPLYKYMMAEHADTALKFGRFRIGTLQEYRSSEYGKGIQDGQEGIKQYVPLLENIKDLTPEQFSAQYPQLAQVIREQGRFKSSMQNIKEGIPVALEVQAPNCYVFCMTATFDPQSVTDFGYNTCVEIIDPYEFAKALTEEIYQMVNYGVIEACEYFNRSAPYHGHDGWRPQILKDTHYAHQKEVRILWDPWNHEENRIPSNTEVQPVFVESKKAAIFCRRVL